MAGEAQNRRGLEVDRGDDADNSIGGEGVYRNPVQAFFLP